MFTGSQFYVSNWNVSCEVLVPTQIPMQSVFVSQVAGQNGWRCV